MVTKGGRWQRADDNYQYTGDKEFDRATRPLNAIGIVRIKGKSLNDLWSNVDKYVASIPKLHSASINSDEGIEFAGNWNVRVRYHRHYRDE